MTTGELVEAHLRQLDDIERRGRELLDDKKNPANPARMAADLYAVITALQVQDRFLSVHVGKLEDVMENVATAQLEDSK